MIRGPVLPLTKEGLWRLLRGRPQLLERNLDLCAEDLELGTGGLGTIDGLFRDAAGGPVLVVATDDRDHTLVARALAAHAFWRRNVDGMARALPEADLRASAPCRLLVVGSGMPPGTVEALEQLRLDGLEIVEVEPFHVGDEERLCMRTRRAPGESAPLDAAIGDGPRALMAALTGLLQRLDPRICVDGDRFSRRASHQGRPLCDYWYAQERVHGALPGGACCVLRGPDDVRSFADQVARRYLAMCEQTEPPVRRPAAPGGGPAAAEAPAAGATPPEAPGRGPRAGGLEALRASLSHARLSREEWTALGETSAGEDPPPSG